MATPTYAARKVGDEYVLEDVTRDEHGEMQGQGFAGGVHSPEMAIAGGLLTLIGLRRLGLLGAASLVGGGCLLYQGITGRSLMGGAHHRRRGRRHAPASQRAQEEVDEASMESFPASDAPSRHGSDPTGV